MKFWIIGAHMAFISLSLPAQESAQWQLRAGLHAHLRPLVANVELAGHMGLNITGIWLRKGLQGELGLSAILSPKGGVLVVDGIGAPLGLAAQRYWELRLAPALLYRVKTGAFVAAAGLQARISPWQAVRTGILPAPGDETGSRWYPVNYYRALGAAMPVEVGLQIDRLGMLLRYEQSLISRLPGARDYPERASHLQLSASWQLR